MLLMYTTTTFLLWKQKNTLTTVFAEFFNASLNLNLWVLFIKVQLIFGEKTAGEEEMHMLELWSLDIWNLRKIAK